MSDYLFKEAIRYALEEGEMVINHIEGDSIKRVIKDVDFYYKDIKYYITIEVINNVESKNIYIHKFSNKSGNGESMCYYKFEEVIGIACEDVDMTINMMLEISEFTPREMKLIEAVRVEFVKNKKK